MQAVRAKAKIAPALRRPGRTECSSNGPQLKLRAGNTGVTAHDRRTKRVSMAAIKKMTRSFNITDAQIHET